MVSHQGDLTVVITGQAGRESVGVFSVYRKGAIRSQYMLSCLTKTRNLACKNLIELLTQFADEVNSLCSECVFVFVHIPI